MDVIAYCITAIIIALIIGYCFGPNVAPVHEVYIEPEASEEEKKQAQEEEDQINGFVTALGEVNKIFGGVEDEEN